MDSVLVDENHNANSHERCTLDERTIRVIDGDDVLKFLGRFGMYQKWQILLIFLVSTTLAIPILSGLFVGKQVDFKCAQGLDETIPSNASLVLSTCSKKLVQTNSSLVLSEEKCTDYQFDGNGTALSYIAEWKLVCEDEALGNLPQTLTMIGMAVGASTLPQIGDRFGRKKLIVGSLVAIAAVNLAIAFIPQFEVFVVLKFLSGALNQGFMVPISVLMIELLPTEMRAIASLFSCSYWVVSSLLVGVIGYVMKDSDWRTMQIVFGAVSAAIIIFLCFLDESLRWLLGNNKVSDAGALIKKACRMNNKDYQELLSHAVRNKEENGVGEPGTHHTLLSPLEKPDNLKTVAATEGESKILMLLKNHTMRRTMLIMCYTWMITALTYYGLILLSTSLAGDPYVNYFIIAFTEWPSGVLMVFCIHRYGRKRTLLAFQFISGVSLICAVLIANLAPSDDNVYSVLQTAFTMTGKFFVSGSFNAVWIYTPELYPTNLRNIGIGMSSAAARVGATFSPFFTMLARVAVWVPGALFAVGCFINVFLLTLVPETRWRELPNDISDIEAWVKDDSKKKHGHVAEPLDEAF